MSAETHTVVDEQNPWPGLDAFDEAAQRFFNGRENEAAALRRLVLNAPLTVLFSASGLGKTSLIQAGLFPLLRKENFLPIRIRLDCRDRRAPLIDQVKLELRNQISALHIDAPPLNGNRTLWQYLHRDKLELWSGQNQLLTPVFVLDQFEEVFTLGAENRDAISQLLTDLADLVENRIPAALANDLKRDEAAGAGLQFDSQRYRVLLSFREDFLPAVEGWKRQMPSILRNRLRLLPMTGERAFKAVHDTAPHLVDEPLAWKIVRFVAVAQDDSLGSPALLADAVQDVSIEPALLSLVCEGLNQKRKAQNRPAFDDALLTGTGQSIVADFYERSVRDLPDHVQRFIEKELITQRGFRKPCDVDDARSVYGVTAGELGLLENRRLLRIEPQHGTDRVELIHDLLTGVVREHRDQQLKREIAEKKRKEHRQKQKAVLTISAIVLLAILTAAGTFFARRFKQDHDRMNMLGKAESLRHEGYHHRQQRRYAEASLSLRSALDIYRRLEDHKDQVSTLIDIGSVLAAERKFADAESTYEGAREICKEKREPDLEGNVLEALAFLSEQEHKIPQALDYYDKANHVYEDSGDYEAIYRVSRERVAALSSVANESLGSKPGEVSWGFLVDLLSGQVHDLTSYTVNIGRDVEGVKNDISFSDRLVSRRHLAISRDLHIDDMRSRNGTTLNARLLPYGIGAKLSDQDIIVLANVEPLQFWLKKPPAPLSVPKDAWAIFIDGESKGYRYLTGQEYSLAIKNEKLSFQPGSFSSALLSLRRVQDKPQMLIAKSEWNLVFTLKETDYEYKNYIAKTGEWDDALDVPVSFVKLSPDEKNIALEGPAFQIVFFNAPLP